MPITDPEEQGGVDEFENSLQELARHAFGETADPSDYVAREATDSLLRRLEGSVLASSIPAALIAAPGMGKSMLLRVFAQRARATTRVAELAYGALAFEDLCEWTLGLLGLAIEGPASEALLRASKSQDITIVIDDASSLPADTAHQLGELVRSGAPQLRLAIAAPDGYAAGRVLAALGEPLEELRLTDPMSPDETRNYLQHRLAGSTAPTDLRQKLRSGALARVLRLSGGVPRRVHTVVHEVVLDLPADVRAEWRDEDWIGAPLDELGSLGELDDSAELVAADIGRDDLE